MSYPLYYKSFSVGPVFELGCEMMCNDRIKKSNITLVEKYQLKNSYYIKVKTNLGEMGLFEQIDIRNHRLKKIMKRIKKGN